MALHVLEKYASSKKEKHHQLHTKEPKLLDGKKVENIN